MPESLDDALIECVKAAGGSKVVASRLWPAKLVDAAQRHLLACLNEGRAEHLKPDEVLLVMRLARDAGCHTGMGYLAHALGYAEPVPTAPRDEAAELQRQFVEATRQMAAMAARLEQLQPLVERAALKAVA